MNESMDQGRGQQKDPSGPEPGRPPERTIFQLSHDINNSLQLITGNAEIGIRSPWGDDRARELFQRILYAAERVKVLNGELAAISRSPFSP